MEYFWSWTSRKKNDGQYWSMNLNFLPIRPSNPVNDTESHQSSSFLGSEILIRTHSRWIWSIGMILKNRCPSLGVERCWLHGRLWCMDGFIQGIFPFEFEWFFHGFSLSSSHFVAEMTHARKLANPIWQTPNFFQAPVDWVPPNT